MKYWLFAFILISIFSIGLSEYNAVLEEEFNGETLDSKDWDIEFNFWSGKFNEKKCYSPKNIQLKDGKLLLRAITDDHEEPSILSTENNLIFMLKKLIKSGKNLNLGSNTGSFLYGKVEIRAKMPKGKLLRPNIILLPTDNSYGEWAKSGEIDILDFHGQEPNNIINAIHFGGAWPNNTLERSNTNLGIDLTEDFHIYSLDWTPENIKWYFDEKKTFEFDLRNKLHQIYDHSGAPFDKRFHIAVRLSVAGNSSNARQYGDSDFNDTEYWKDPMLEIDYIRVYEKSHDANNSIGPNNNKTDNNNCVDWSVPLFPFMESQYDLTSLSTSDVGERLQISRNDMILFKFFLPNTIPAQSSLMLYGNASFNPLISLYLLENDWNEQIGFHPSLIGLVSSIQIDGSNEKYHKWDVSDHLRNLVKSGSNVISFALSSSDRNSYCQFHSYHSNSIFKPYLIIGFK